MEEKLHFKVSSGLKDIIGKDLITNELVAIFEFTLSFKITVRE